MFVILKNVSEETYDEIFSTVSRGFNFDSDMINFHISSPHIQMLTIGRNKLNKKDRKVVREFVGKKVY